MNVLTTRLSQNIAASTLAYSQLALVALQTLSPQAAASSQGDEAFTKSVRPILKEFCVTCHSTEKQKGDLDLERFETVEQIRREPSVWEHALEQIRDKEMPPKDKPKPSPEQLVQLTAWMQSTLDEVALASAGDPGPVVLRRLSNMEYTYTIRDLTNVQSLNPAKEFPVDGAAGEGFTNAGAALVMSPSLLGKYLDAAKAVAAHAVLTQDGIRFSEGTSPREWTNENLERIRSFYARFCGSGEGGSVIQQGIKLDTGSDGKLPLKEYLAAVQGKSEATGLSPKYLAALRAALAPGASSPVMAPLRAKYAARTLEPSDIEPWQKSLWKLNSIGHLGKVGGPKAWMEPVTPLASSQQIKFKLTPPADGSDLTVYLSTADAGDGNDQDFALWENPRLVVQGRPDLPLRNVSAALQHLAKRREEVLSTVSKCLAAAHEADTHGERTDVQKLAQKYNVDAGILTDWLNFLGLGSQGAVKLGPLVAKKLQSASGYDFVKGWTGDAALGFQANSSDQTVRVPGTLKPHSIAVHPSPKLAAVVAWKSPVAGELRIHGSLQDADTACGNGVAWELQLRRGNTREALAAGSTDKDKLDAIEVQGSVRVQPDDVIALVVDPKEGNHACDLTAVELTLESGNSEWNLAKDVSPDILAGNPHADRLGHKEVWFFLGEPAGESAGVSLPKGSLLSEWKKARDADSRSEIATKVEKLLRADRTTLTPGSPDHALLSLSLALNGPLLGSGLRNFKAPQPDNPSPASPYGIDPALFGKHPDAQPVAPETLCIKAPALLEVKLPAQLVDGAELVATGRLHPGSGPEASVQLLVSTSKPPKTSGLQAEVPSAKTESGAWTSSKTTLDFSSPILVQDGSPARARFESSFEEFRSIFPATLCYTRIVPVDEVVTLTLFHREDDTLTRLMLDDVQKAELDREWEELHFVSQDALTLVDAFEQIWQFSTQDGPDKPNGDKRLAPLREPIMRGAEAFKKVLMEKESIHLAAALDFAARAWRRPLTAQEHDALRSLYSRLRKESLPHSEAIRMLLARTLIAPAFLYRGEKPAPGLKAAPVSDWEMATRLSYFLWSGPPDAELSAAAQQGKLSEPAQLAAQMRRMLTDPRIRRLATEFGCQWLHVRELESLDEKSERHFPTFTEVRSDLQEEAVLFFSDFFAGDRSALSLLDADHTFLNASLAAHYGIELQGKDWQRVDGMRAKGRGGILGFGSTLAKQSGASRTSPILRGNWLSEVVLGEKLPRPPKGVPILPEEAPQGLTERQLIEKHSSDAACSACHKRIDPFGFALEGFDAVGRARTTDAAGLRIDTRTVLPDGTAIEGLPGLRDALLQNRSDAFLRQFCRKLLGYALGRGVQLSDKPLITAMVADLKAHDYRVSVALEKIVASPQFREVRGKDFETTAAN